MQADYLPVIKTKQRTAFPPNYIHSLDSAHMMLTAIACSKAGEWVGQLAPLAAFLIAALRRHVCGRARLLLDTRCKVRMRKFSRA